MIRAVHVSGWSVSTGYLATALHPLPRIDPEKPTNSPAKSPSTEHDDLGRDNANSRHPTSIPPCIRLPYEMRRLLVNPSKVLFPTHACSRCESGEVRRETRLPNRMEDPVRP
jgi:hypothetical protein